MVRLSCGWSLVLHLFEKRPSLGLLAVPFVGQHVLSAKALARPPLPGCAVVQLRNSAEWVDSRQKPVCGKRSAIVAPSLDAQSAPAGHDLQLLPSLVVYVSFFLQRQLDALDAPVRLPVVRSEGHGLHCALLVAPSSALKLSLGQTWQESWPLRSW